MAWHPLYTIRTMPFKDFKTKDSVVVVYTGESKGKTSASLGLMVRALGTGWRVAYIQFIKFWVVGEHTFIQDVMPIYGDRLHFHKGGKGFYNAGALSEKGVTEAQHLQAALDTYNVALECATSGKYDLVICDEINNAVHDGLLSVKQLKELIVNRSQHTSLCLTGRDFPQSLHEYGDIITTMTKIKHHYDDKFLANQGIDY